MQTVTPEQVIGRAATIIADKSHWTTGTEARDANGFSVPVNSSEAVKFCARGAVMRATMELTGQPAVRPTKMGFIQCGCGSCVTSVNGGLHPVFIAAMNKLDTASRNSGSIVSINDHQGHEMVMQVMSRAQCTVSGTVFAIPPAVSIMSYIDTTTTMAEMVLVEVPKLVEYVPATPLEPIKATAKDYRDLAIVPEKRTALLASVGVS